MRKHGRLLEWEEILSVNLAIIVTSLKLLFGFLLVTHKSGLNLEINVYVCMSVCLSVCLVV